DRGGVGRVAVLLAGPGAAVGERLALVVVVSDARRRRRRRSRLLPVSPASAGRRRSVLSTVTEPHVPSPADTPQFTAEQFLQELRHRGARIFRMREVFVFCLTNDPDVARWLLELGARPYKPFGTDVSLGGPMGAYTRAKGGRAEWDM